MATGIGVAPTQKKVLHTGQLTDCFTVRSQMVFGFFIDATTANAAIQITFTPVRQQITTLIGSKLALIHHRQTSTAETFATVTDPATCLRMTSGLFGAYAQKVSQGQR